MFNKKTIKRVMSDYKDHGIFPDTWAEDSKEMDNLTKIGFLMIINKVFDGELKNLKKLEEENLTESGLKTDTIVISYKKPYTTDKLLEEGKDYLKINHPAWLEERLTKGSYTWKLR